MRFLFLFYSASLFRFNQNTAVPKQTLDFVEQNQQFSEICPWDLLLPVATVRSAENRIILIWMVSPMVLWLCCDEYIVFCLFVVLDSELHKALNSKTQE